MTSSTTLRRRLAPLLLLLGAFIVQTTQAKDLSLPYRNYPGFVCHSTNARGECVDYSYFDYAAPVALPGYIRPIPANTYDPVNSYNANLLPCPVNSNAYNYNNNYNYANYNDGNCGDQVSVRLTSAPKQIAPGERITYRVYVRNDSQGIQTAAVRLLLDPNTSFVSASNGGSLSSSSLVTWALSFASHANRTLLVTVQTNPNLNNGSAIHASAQANQSQDETVTDVRFNGYNGYTNNTNYYYSSPCTSSNAYYNCNQSCSSWNGSTQQNCNTNTNYNNSYNNNCYGSNAYNCANNSNCNSANDFGSSNCNSSSNSYCDTGSSGCHFSLTITPSATNVTRSQLVTFNLLLRNNDSLSHIVDVLGNFDQYQSFSSASDNGYQLRTGQVQWTAISMPAYSSRTVSVTTMINANIPQGSTLRFSADAGNVHQSISTYVQY